MKFINFLIESNVTVFHGSKRSFDKIDTKYFFLDIGNAQEGIGMYFGDLKTAEMYGDHINQITLQPDKFIESHKPVSKLTKKATIKFLKELFKLNKESMFYWITDYGIYVESPKNINVYMLNDFYENFKEQEIRNFQIEAAQNFTGAQVIEAWNKTFKNIHGLKNTQYNFYILINPDYKLTKYK